MGVGRHCPDHVGGVDVFERGVELLLLAVLDDLGLEELADVRQFDIVGHVSFHPLLQLFQIKDSLACSLRDHDHQVLLLHQLLVDVLEESVLAVDICIDPQVLNLDSGMRQMLTSLLALVASMAM